MENKREPAKTKMNILQAAFSEIYRHGFQSARTEGIIAKTGLTRGALYHHFKDKHSLGNAVLTEIIEEQFPDVEIVMGTPDMPEGEIAEKALGAIKDTFCKPKTNMIDLVQQAGLRPS